MSDSTPNPHERAKQYREELGTRDTTQARGDIHRSPEQWRDLISQRIEEAMREGQFDNLRGKGKPLDPSPHPHVPADMQMANSLLKNNELTPAWIADRNQVLAAVEHFRAKLRRATMEYRKRVDAASTEVARAAIEQRWQALQHGWQEEIRILNRRIELQNLKQPVTFLEIYKLRLEDELKRAEKE